MDSGKCSFIWHMASHSQRLRSFGYFLFYTPVMRFSFAGGVDHREEEEESLRGRKWGLSSVFISPLIRDVSLCVRAAQCAPCLCLSPLIKTFGFLQLAVEECVSVWACVWETWRGVRGRKCSSLYVFLSIYGQWSLKSAHPSKTDRHTIPAHTFMFPVSYILLVFFTSIFFNILFQLNIYCICFGAPGQNYKLSTEVHSKEIQIWNVWQGDVWYSVLSI